MLSDTENTHADSQVYECTYEDCDETYPLHESVGDFCSEECLYRDKVQGTFNMLRDSRTVCSTCFAMIRVKNHPDDDQLWRLDKQARESFVGYEYATANAVEGHDGRLGCRCGSFDHAEDHAELEGTVGFNPRTDSGGDQDMAIYRDMNLYGQLCRLYEAGVIDHEPSMTRFAHARWTCHMDLRAAAGVAIYGD